MHLFPHSALPRTPVSVQAESSLRADTYRQKNQRALHAKLKGSTLGDAGKDDIDSASWAKKLKKRAAKREAELAARRAKEMAEADAAAYDERDLVGLRVAHDTDDLVEGEDVVLTLRDSRVLDGEEDELQNVALADREADAARAERARRAKAQYTGYDDEEFTEGRIGKKASVLAKYDDGFTAEDAKTDGFRLGEALPQKKVEEEDVEMGKAPDMKVKLSLDFSKDWEVDDYASPAEVKVKKRKVKRKARKREVDPEDEEDQKMDVEESTPTFERRRVDDAPDNLVDDDDLQAALARTRRQQNKKKRMRPEDIAERIRAEREAEPAEQEEEGEDDGRITFDETSEFVRNVTVEGKIGRPRPVEDRTRSRSRSVTGTPGPAPTSNGDAQIIQVERVEGLEDDSSDEEDGDDELAEMAAREGMSLAEYRAKIDAQMAEMSTLGAEDAVVPTLEEPKVTQGLAGVLALLRNQGALEKKDAATIEAERRKERLQKQHDLWLADHKRRLAREEMEKLAARGTAAQKDQAQREYENRQREMAEARAALEEFKHYRPEVELKYHDEFGREMTPKEAWKSLSHRFHGKTSGRMKTEKRLKKIEEERKAKAMLAGDTPLGMGAAFQRRQEKTGQAHMVLSVGNRGSVQKK